MERLYRSRRRANSPTPANFFPHVAVRQTGELKMPPNEKLGDEQVADLSAWVKAGAPWATVSLKSLDDAGKNHWAFQAVHAPATPNISHLRARVNNPIDEFIQAKLE